MKQKQGQWEPAKPALDNAKRELCDFAKEYFRAGRKTARKGTSAERLHQFRLATKHFRYLLELFEPLYGKRLDGLVRQLRQVQTILGELNDFTATAALLADRKENTEVQQLFQYLHEERRKKRREFRHHWKLEFDAEGEELRWLSILGRVRRSSVVISQSKG